MSKYVQENMIPNFHKLLKMIVELLLHIAHKLFGASMVLQKKKKRNC